MARISPTGYGNTAPATTGGRALVFTIGFCSILVFAVVLRNAGTIVTAICDDGVDRVRFLSVLQNDWLMCLFWGVLYYSWMAVVAWKTDLWKEERLGEEFSFRDAYWFRYVVMVMVGLPRIRFISKTSL